MPLLIRMLFGVSGTSQKCQDCIDIITNISGLFRQRPHPTGAKPLATLDE